MRLDDIPTPALCVDLDALERNLERMAGFFRSPIAPATGWRCAPRTLDPTVNLHDRLYALRGHEVVDVWPVAARGHPPPDWR